MMKTRSGKLIAFVCSGLSRNMHRRKFLPGRSQSGAPGVPVPSWDDYDPRAEAFFSEENRYSTGPGVFLPSEQQPYSTR